MNKLLAEKLKTLPNSPGVYFHKNKNGEIIYVGKAANLKNRVRQYFQNIAAKDVKTQALVAEIEMTDWTEVETEVDALFLESEMIKRYKPQYNILLRDDKSQTYVRIGFKDKIPSISFTRIPADDNGEYFGPFYNGFAVKKSLRLLRKIFPYYTNRTLPERAGLDFQMGLTPGLEAAKDTDEFEQKMIDYKTNLRTLARYLKGERKKIQREIERDMKNAAAIHDFEKAVKKRNQLRDMSELGRQIIFSKEEFLDISKDQALVKITEILALKDIPRRIEAYDISHTGGENTVASMVVFTNGLADKKEYRKFKMRTSGNDDYLHMKEVLTRRFSQKNSKWQKPDLIIVDGGKGQLSSAIEILENSNGAKDIPVVGIAKRDEEIVVDSEKSNVGSSWILEQIENPSDDINITKEGKYYLINLHFSQIHSSGHAKNLLGSSNSAYSDLTKLFQRIRDEAHRFAISYHSTLRTKNQTKNILEDIPGIGPKSRSKLLKNFGSLKKIKEASRSDLVKVLGGKMGESLYEILRSKK